MLFLSLLKSGDQLYLKVINQLYLKMMLLNLLITLLPFCSLPLLPGFGFHGPFALFVGTFLNVSDFTTDVAVAFGIVVIDSLRHRFDFFGETFHLVPNFRLPYKTTSKGRETFRGGFGMCRGRFFGGTAGEHITTVLRIDIGAFRIPIDIRLN